MFLLLGQLILAAQAGEPTRCYASWTGPVPGCAIKGKVSATATGPNEQAAERALERQLTTILDLRSQAMMARIPYLAEAAFMVCEEMAATRAFVNCFPEPELAEPAFCFARFNNPDCWTGEVLAVEAVGWRVLGEGRSRMCGRVDERIVAKGYSDTEKRRATCAASCVAETTVLCPASEEESFGLLAPELGATRLAAQW